MQNAKFTSWKELIILKFAIYNLQSAIRRPAATGVLPARYEAHPSDARMLLLFLGP